MSPDAERRLTGAPADLALGSDVFATERIAGNPMVPRRRSRSDLRRIEEIRRVVSGGLDWSKVLDEAARACVGLAGSERCVLLLWDMVHDEVVVASDKSASGDGELAYGTRTPLKQWAGPRSVLFNQEPLIVELPEETRTLAEREFATSQGATSFMYVPLIAFGECLGILLLVRGAKGPFRRHHLRFAESAARVIGPALATAKMLDVSKSQAAARGALFAISQAAVSMDDQPTVLRTIAKAASAVLESDSCTIQIWNRESDAMETLAIEVSNARPIAAADVPLKHVSDFRSLRFVLEQQTPLHMHPRQIGLTDLERDELTSSGTESLLIVPMTIAGDTLGVILVASSRPRAFDGEAINVAQEIAAQTALAIQNARFVERTKRHVEEQSVLLRVSQAVISSRSLSGALSDIARASLEFDSVEGCRILLWNDGSDRVELAAEENVADWPTFYQLGDRYPLADWPTIRHVMATRMARSYLVSDSGITARERANHVADGVGSFGAIPIVIGPDCLGCLALHSRADRGFSQDTMRVGLELATQVAHAINRARLFKQLRTRAETDGLTGLLNHRAAFEALDRELAAARQNSTAVGVIVIDLDDFKLFNDTHGHLIGDRVLVDVAGVLNEVARPSDHVARFGGDEFLVILPSASVETTRTIAERLVQRMDLTAVAIGDLLVPIRSSIGISTFPHDARNRQELIAFADSSMYAAKELGGGQVGSVTRGTRSLEVSTLGALSGLVRAVDRKDRYTKDHSDLVAEYAVRFGLALRMIPEKIEALELAGQLHDVGKIAVPDSILRKPGFLTPEEHAMIRQHVVFSELMIKGVPHLDDVLAAVAHHHERWDGGGYPFGKSGTQIPLLGRILALADALAAMTSDRPYRKGRSLKQAVQEIRAGANTQFDPDLVEPFIRSVTTHTALLQEESRHQASMYQIKPPVGSARAERSDTSPLDETAIPDELVAVD